MADRSKRHLERVLRECAESAVPETASPWPAIKDRLGGREAGEAQAVEILAVEGRAMGAPAPVVPSSSRIDPSAGPWRPCRC